MLTAGPAGPGARLRTAVAGFYNEKGAVLLRLDPVGEVLAVHRCNAGSKIDRLEIDVAGVVYASGPIDASETPFIAVFDG